MDRWVCVFMKMCSKVMHKKWKCQNVQHFLVILEIRNQREKEKKWFSFWCSLKLYLMLSYMFQWRIYEFWDSHSLRNNFSFWLAILYKCRYYSLCIYLVPHSTNQFRVDIPRHTHTISLSTNFVSNRTNLSRAIFHWFDGIVSRWQYRK